MKKNLKLIFLVGSALSLIVAYFILDSMLFDGVRAQAIQEDGMVANYFALEGTADQTAVVLLGGGQWGDYWAQEFASREMVGLSLPYTGWEGLPTLPENIDLAYFEKALLWLGKKAEVNADKIVLMGASKNAELALVLGASFPELVSGVIAYAPSSVSWSNTALPYNSDEMMASWQYKGEDIPYIPMEKPKANDSGAFDMLAYWQKGLEKTAYVDSAMIEVNRIKGPVLLFSGADDQVWPSVQMADMIAKRMDDFNFEYSFQNFQYENAGHLISTNPDAKTSNRNASIELNGKQYEYTFGGTDQGDYIAKQDARSKVFDYLKKI